jgi:hypothetical protein
MGTVSLFKVPFENKKRGTRQGERVPLSEFRLCLLISQKEGICGMLRVNLDSTIRDQGLSLFQQFDVFF